jgi:hypothetical protein
VVAAQTLAPVLRVDQAGAEETLGQRNLPGQVIRPRLHHLKATLEVQVLIQHQRLAVVVAGG